MYLHFFSFFPFSFFASRTDPGRMTWQQCDLATRQPWNAMIRSPRLNITASPGCCSNINSIKNY